MEGGGDNNVLLRLLQARGLRGEVGGDVQERAINAASVSGGVK